MFIRCFLLTFLAAQAAPLAAMPRPSPMQVEAYRQDGSFSGRRAFASYIGNNRLRPGAAAQFRRRAAGARAAAAGAPPPAWAGMPTTGTPKILVLMIDFPDYPHAAANTSAAVSAKVFGAGAGQYPYESLANYYNRSSYGLLNIQGATLGWFSTTTARSSISTTTDAGREALIMDALNYYNGLGHDFAQYDNDGDGTIDYFAVLWTGPDNGWGGYWWAYATSFLNPAYTVDGKKLGYYSWQWESSPSGGTFWPRTLIHETGHALGVPDYYDYDGSVGPDGGLGGLDMMDSSTGDHNAFTKFMLGWLTPTNLPAGNSDAALRPADAFPDAVKVMPDSTAGIFEEYFLVQNRRASGNDLGLPGSGLLIWHVDARLDGAGQDFLYDNSYTAHKLLRLMEADGLEEIETGSLADAGDYYGPLSRFGPATAPNSARYSGAPSGVYVENVGALEAARSFAFGVEKKGGGNVSVTDNLFRPGAGGRCRLDVTAPFAGQLTIKAYTVNGEFLKTVYSGQAAAGLSSYSWGGETESGGAAASGLYLIKLKGPGVDSIKKVVLLR